MAQTNAIEAVIFKTVQHIPTDEAQKTLLSMTSILEQFEGYQRRHLSRAEDGTWLDLVYWATMDDAQRAAQAVMQMPEAMAAFSVIDQSTLQFLHLVPVQEMGME